MSNVKELLEAFAGPAEPEKMNGAAHRKPAHTATGDTPYGLKALADECRIVATTPQGGRETALNLACLKMGSLIAGNELTQGTVERELREAAQRSGLDEREIETKFRHSIPDGMKTPRSAPATREIVFNDEEYQRLAPGELPDIKDILQCLDMSEWGDSLLFARMFRGKVLYDHVEKVWYIWQVHFWKVDDTGAIKSYVSGKLATVYIRTAAKINEEIATLNKTEEVGKEESKVARLKKQYSALLHRAVELRTLARCKNILTFASSHKGMSIIASQWDTNRWLLAFPNCVLDLKTGTPRDGQPTDYIRTVCPSNWEGLNAPHTRYDQFLQQIFADREEDKRHEVISFLQRLFGYGITGEVREHIFAILYGEDGRNGKDTLEKAISHAMGATSSAISKDVLLDMGKHTAGGATPHLCDLQGKRIAWANEPEKGARFNVGQVKDLSGGGDIPVRPLYAKDYYKIKPTHLLVMLTNHKPHADASDSAFWDRLRLITFNMRFVDNPDPKKPNERKKDPALWDTLEAEASGIMAWLVRGCLEWQRIGLATPDFIIQDGMAYRQEEDNIALFVDERCTLKNPTATTRAGQLYTAYAMWCKAGNMQAFSSTNFGKWMVKRFKKEKDAKGFYYQGIGLLESEDVHTCVDSVHTPSSVIDTPVVPDYTVSQQAGNAYDAYQNPQSGIYSRIDTTKREVSEISMHSMQEDIAQNDVNTPVVPDEEVCIPSEKVCTNHDKSLGKCEICKWRDAESLWKAGKAYCKECKEQERQRTVQS